MEEIITSAQHVPSEKAVQALREQLNQDTQILASLDPNSHTHHRLAARVERQAAELLDYEDQLERQREQQRQAQQRALVEQRRRDEETAKAQVRIGGFISVVIGGFITYVGWGTWWLVLGIVLILIGLCGLFGTDD